MFRTVPVLVLTLLLDASSAAAQTAPPVRIDLGALVGYGQTSEDEGDIGGGVTVGGMAGWRVLPRLTLGVLVERVAHDRDMATFHMEGAGTWIGADATWRFGSGRVRPAVSFGAGVLPYRGEWLAKSDGQILRFRSNDGGVTGAFGVDVPLNDRFALRPEGRVYAIQPARDGVPWLIGRVAVAAVGSW
jgi:hypothetical protein